MTTDASLGTMQYLTYKLADEVYAFEISKVREVLDFTPLTKVPKMPDFLRGVINLRGSVVPVVDLRLKFGMEKTERTANTCVIITEVRVDGEPVILGTLADAVHMVMDLDSGSIEPPPKIGTGLNTSFIRGMGKHQEGFIIILDIDRMFSADEQAAFQAAAELPSRAA